jgi:3-hydroxy-5-methyl-1-naphthoate 3-O-methyltransferase
MMETTKPGGGKPLTPERIMQFAFGYAPPLMIEVAVRHRVFDVLDAGPKTLDQVSKETNCSVRGLRAIMNALVSLEFLAKEGDRYKLTPESASFLVSGKPGFHGGLIKHTSEQLLPKWLQLNEIVRTGKPATSVNQQGDGTAFFKEFVEAIFPLSYPAATVLGDELKLSVAKGPVSVLDLASGSGVWGIALAQKSPNVKVTAVDWPSVLETTKRVAERFKLADRFTFSPGDLTDANFGTGHNIATLGHILHSEGAERSKALLKKTYAALATGGTIAIAEFVPNDDRTGPPGALIFAVNMLVNTDLGDTFTFSEISGWLKDAGFGNIRQLAAPGPSPLILGTK